ncbi:CRISPR-associated endoribonuclease Cas6 [Thermaerobacter subterraneus]|uniref:CRISPR-associated endoribonuclease Cas6 n=1 Tax=Thermaerobacter subterraneus DSM 13965 TaxID=867903 RepID=K6PRI1_9FIRM|nr:CRISPR-associated endoribonuclease Cas6 [Thermaerobacter subterraneus]EKP95532.1 CRISPR-associated endoribonuclease Cas6 [Thermaerobacter subterraneus DSM 13965]
MRVIMELRPVSGQLVLPLQYNSLLQGLVYHLLEGTDVAEFLHDQGFTRGARRYKMFTFSRLEGLYTIERSPGGPVGRGSRSGLGAGGSPDGNGPLGKGEAGGTAGTSDAAGILGSSGNAGRSGTGSNGVTIPVGTGGTMGPHKAGGPDHGIGTGPSNGTGLRSGTGSNGSTGNKMIRFAGSVRLTVSSPYAPVVHALASRALQLGTLRLGSQLVEIKSVRFEELPSITPPVTLRARTPITVYSTVNRPDGSRFTYFFEPRSGEFERLVAENVVRKWEAFTGRTYEGPGIQIRWRGAARGHVARFRHGIIKGFTGIFEATGDPALIALGLEAGFGSKNAQGFGLCDVLPPRGWPLPHRDGGPATTIVPGGRPAANGEATVEAAAAGEAEQVVD